MKTRRWWLGAIVALAACGEKPQMPADLFPTTAAGGWTLTETRDLGPADAPDPVPRNSIEQIRAATYKMGGPAKVGGADQVGGSGKAGGADQMSESGRAGGPDQMATAEIDARVYLLSSAEVGATLGTRWRPSADTVFFDKGEYFVVVKWQGPDRKAVQEFVADLQKRLGAQGRRKAE